MTVELFVFDSTSRVVEALAGPDSVGRADAIVVDWERSGKSNRQRHALALLGVETQIAPEDPVNLGVVVQRSQVPVVCRIDGWDGHGRTDIERAVEAGASDVIVPMVRGPGEVDSALVAAADRVGVGVMIETTSAVDSAREIAAMPISMAYLGLMDLALERGTPDIFTALSDGTLDFVAEAFAGVPFGFAGLTLPGKGHPVPTRSLAAEMVRVGASFTFLRRSFLADAGEDLAGGLQQVRAMVADLSAPVAVTRWAE